MSTNSDRYTTMIAISNLPSGGYIYEANCNLRCAKCGGVIAANSLFGRRVPEGRKRPMPHCRTCLPFHLYDDKHKKRVVPDDEEYLYVSEYSDLLRL